MRAHRPCSQRSISYLRTVRRLTWEPTRTATADSGEAIQAFPRRAGYELVEEFYDAAVSGADPIDTRPGFGDMLERIEGNGVRTINTGTGTRAGVSCRRHSKRR